MKDGFVKQAARALVGGALVAAPAFGGQLVSAVAKAMSPTIANVPDTLVDAIACAGVGAAETALMGVIGGKKALVKTAVLALIGTGMGIALPAVDDGIDSVVQGILGTKGTAAAVAPGGRLRSIPGGVPRSSALGGTIPGGVPRTQALGGTIPGGGRDGVASTRAYAGSSGKRSSPPGGVL